MEKEVNKARHDVATLAKEVHNINYQISSIDTKVETKKNERHNILIQSKVSHHIQRYFYHKHNENLMFYFRWMIL